MNQRIKELAQQAHFHSDQIWLDQDRFEKFAGLIVAECMEVFSKDLPEPGDGRMLEVVDRVCNVAEHFGVEQ
jgi:hypothetical protein